MVQTKGLPPDLPQLPSHWEWYMLQELIQPLRNICYGVVQPGDYTVGGIPIVRAKGIKDGRVEEPNPLRIALEIDAKHTKSRLFGGEILITLVGEYFGQVAIAPLTFAGFNTARAVGVIPVKEDAQFISLALRAPITQHYIKTWATTTAQPTLNLCDVARLPIPMPPKWERDRIAHILGTLDDKIELNQQMNHTLESIARALFKSWFIDFDPIHAKMNGQQPAGMDAETAALFPDEFEDSAIGQIPKGWKAGILGDVCLVQGGFAYKSKDFTDVGYPVIKIKNINEDTTVDVDDVQYIPETIALKTKNFWLNNGDLIMAMTGATVGKFGIVLNKDLPCLLNQRVAKLIPLERQGNSNSFIYFALLQTDVADQVFSIAEGSAQPNISANGIMGTQLVIPTNFLIKNFNNKVDSILCKILANRIESRTLASIRDVLLPNLLSGEFPVKDAEKVMGKAA